MKKRAVSTYGFINAKLKAKIGKMKDDHLDDDLLKAGSLVEAIGILREHGYTEAADTFDKTGDLQMVELSLLKDLIADYQSVKKLTDGYPKELVTTILLKIEVENIKNTIRLWYSAAVHHRPITYRTSYLIKQPIVNKIDYVALTNAITYENIIEALTGTWYQHVLKKFTFEAISKDGLFELETALDKYWYSLYIKACALLTGDDNEVANRMALTEIDLKNTLMLVRYGWFHKMDAKKLENSLFPYGRIYSDKSTHDYINTDPKKREPEVLLKIRYPEIAEKVKEVNITDNKAAMINQTRFIEKFLEEKKHKSFQKILSGKPFTIGIPLAYFYYRESQYYMICGILGGKYYGVDSNEIKGILS
jgi:V/A-type H+-transporting ATPase subunit C